MCPQGAVFLQYSLESVVSSERLFGKRSFSTASAPYIKYGAQSVDKVNLSFLLFVRQHA